MLRKAFLGILMLGTLGSCEWFSSQEARTRALVAEEIRGIDWNQVDQLPLFDACEETTDRREQRACFENTLSMHLSMTLQDFEFGSTQARTDTVYVEFVIDNQGGLAVLSLSGHRQLQEENPQFEGIVSRSMKQLPRLKPAIKQGVPVATQYRLPIIVATDE